MPKNNLPLTEELDFHYLLSLMPPLYKQPEFSWLPELFSIIGHNNLITLCKYAGGERIRIPTLEQLTDSIESLQWFYDVFIKKSKPITDIPVHLHGLVSIISEVYDARNSEESDLRSKRF